MTTERKPVRWHTCLAWFILAFIGAVVVFLVFSIIMSALGESGRRIPNYVAYLILTGCFGIFISLAQWAILKRYTISAWVWIGATLLGFLFSSPSLFKMSGGFGPMIPGFASLNTAIMVGVLLGVPQWLVIRRKIFWGSAWIGISLTGWLLAGLLGQGMKALNDLSGPILYWIGLIIGGALFPPIGIIWLAGRARANETYVPTERPLWRRILGLPETAIGWWSVGLAIATLMFTFLLSGYMLGASFGLTGILIVSMLHALTSWAAGITGLTAISERCERSVIVWIAMLPSVYSLVNILYMAMRDFAA